MADPAVSGSATLIFSTYCRRTELSVIYQNRAAAQERLENLQLAITDLEASIGLNNRYRNFCIQESYVVPVLFPLKFSILDRYLQYWYR